MNLIMSCDFCVLVKNCLSVIAVSRGSSGSIGRTSGRSRCGSSSAGRCGSSPAGSHGPTASSSGTFSI